MVAHDGQALLTQEVVEYRKSLNKLVLQILNYLSDFRVLGRGGFVHTSTQGSQMTLREATPDLSHFSNLQIFKARYHQAETFKI